MALPIKNTPTLTGSDAIRFREAMRNVKKVSPEVKAHIMENYNKIKGLIKNDNNT